ncbi:hypothetical protein N7491_002335 [Penicillium cf. griseofulvum]|uniref:Uncharacterized protein n=1 Tax=Penicillium cf. griseofulvum TaxID=2972120 RepID=A0A9W9T2H3_9EURO|nr:hypothetical protein N7472_003482 [Penicillium cf. griseofulvum]KAJ5446253.1 hypothetical protein N7491_002335 [Penicillium cf. griseofulvum]
MSFNPGYAGHEGGSSHQFYGNQQSYVNQPGSFYPQGFYDQGINFPPTTTSADNNKDETSDNGWYHSTIGQPVMVQQFSVPNQGFVPQEVLTFKPGNVNQQGFSSQEVMGFGESNNHQGNFHQQANIDPGLYTQEPQGVQQLNIHQGNGDQQANIDPGLYTQEPQGVQQLNIHQGNVDQQGNVHQGVYFQEPMMLEQLDNPQGYFHQQGTNINFQNEIYSQQQKKAYQASNPDACCGEFPKAEAETKEALLKRLNRSFDIDAMLNQNNKLLKAAAEFQAAGLANTFAKDQIGQESEDGRNLEHDWIMGALNVNLLYLEARRRREEANKENKG